MAGGSDLDALYKNWPLVLWVEDETTKFYLDTLWQDSQIGFLIAGGWENLRAVVHHAPLHVFGYRDRDFGRSNRARWAGGNVRVLSGDTFEIENFLLDETAMASCSVNTRGLDAGSMNRIAAALPWWMAARATASWLHEQLVEDFVPHPQPRAVPDRRAALASILESEWWTAGRGRLGAAVQRAAIEKQLDAAYARYDTSLKTDGWKQEFSGKEIWSRVWRQLWQRNTGVGDEMDTVKAAATAQRTGNRIPPELADLRAALRKRVNLPP